MVGNCGPESHPNLAPSQQRWQLRPLPATRPGDDRVSYGIAVPLTLDQRAELAAKAQKQMRSVSSYVALVIAENLRGSR